MKFLNRCLFIALIFASSINCHAQTNYDVYILTGQSNSLGTTSSSEAMPLPGTDPADSSTMLFWSNVNASNAAFPPNLYGDSAGLIKSVQTQQGDGGLNSTFWGPEFGFAQSMSDLGQSNVLIIKASRGGGGNGYWDKTTFDANHDNGHMWGHLRDTVDAGLGAIVGSGDTFKVKGLMYLQGESNTGGEASIADTRLNDLITNLKSHIETTYAGSTTEMKTVVGEIAASQSTTSRQTTTTKQMGLAAGNNDMAFIGTRDLALKADNIHFGGKEKLNIGQRYANAMLGRQINQTSFASIVDATESTKIVFDKYVPDANGATNGVNLSSPNTFEGFLNGINNQPKVGLTVEGSSGLVVFADYYGADTTSDIAAGGDAVNANSGQTLTFTFADPTSGRDATVAGVGFELNATAGDNVTVSFLDINGKVLLETGVASDGAIGYESTNSFTGGNESLIHQIVFKSDANELWTLGHRNDLVTTDFAFYGLTAVPEPGSFAMFGLMLAGLGLRCQK